jgi:dTDP-4-amino-4,6-dideoxygalactose transaminase
MDPQRVKDEIGYLKKNRKSPKALIVVHLYGCPADMDPLIDLCREHNLFLIEDATEALGAQYRGKPVGTLGDIGCFSFNGNKLITTGGGGMLVSRSAAYARKARYLTTQARDDVEEYIHHHVGYNYRLSNLQAAVGLAQLEEIERFLRRKREIADC